MTGFRARLAINDMTRLPAHLARIGMGDVVAAHPLLSRHTALGGLFPVWRFEAVVMTVPQHLNDLMASVRQPGDLMRYRIRVSMPSR